MTATLMAHSSKMKSRIMTRAQLARLPEPKASGPYHKPVGHAELLATLQEELHNVLGAKITSEEYAVARKGATLFGVLRLSYGARKDTAAAMGLRHANDRTMSMQFVAGSDVFVCDNLVLRGDLIVMKKRHTVNLDLREEIRDGLLTLKSHVKVLNGEIDQLKSTKLTDDAAKGFILDAFAQHELMPLRLQKLVRSEYFEPRHKEFRPRTAWSLHNAFTEAAKLMPITPRLTATQRLGELFGMTGKV